MPVKISASTYQAAIINYVSLLASNNIAAIIDLQWSAPGQTLADKLVPMPDLDHAPAFWTSVANVFKTNTSVIFDLFNEPYPDNNSDTAAAWACLKNGGTCPGVSYQAASMQTLVDSIRAAGAPNIIMVPGVGYTNVLREWLNNKPNDPANNLVASWHSYANQGCNNQDCWNNIIKPLLDSVPLIAGEIGEMDCQHAYIDSLMNWLDANGGNYLAWAWDTYDCNSFPALISNFDGTPTNFGVGFRDHLVAAHGSTATALPGDLNLDHSINSLDWSVMNSKWFTSDTAADLNHDGVVNAIDFSILNAHWFGAW